MGMKGIQMVRIGSKLALILQIAQNYIFQLVELGLGLNEEEDIRKSIVHYFFPCSFVALEV